MCRTPDQEGRQYEDLSASLGFVAEGVRGRKIDLDAIYIEQMLPKLTDKWFEKAIEKELKRLIRKCERGSKKLRKELKQYQNQKDTSNG